MFEDLPDGIYKGLIRDFQSRINLFSFLYSTLHLHRTYLPKHPVLSSYSTMSSLTTSIPTGSWILVTGASGFLASHISLQFLERGFKVRGTVRDPSQASWLLEGRFKSYADTGAMELVSVPNLGADGAYDEAIKGVSAIIHTAYVTNIVPDPNEVITPMVAGVRSIINAAIREPSVKVAVFTSSALSASPLVRGVDNGIVGRDSWNDAVLEAAWAPPPYGMSHLMANYPASKVAAEKEVWKFVEGDSLHFNVNVVSPAGMTGEPLHKKHIEGQANWVVHAYRGHKAAMDPMPACKNCSSLQPTNYQASVEPCDLIWLTNSCDNSLLRGCKGRGFDPRGSRSGPRGQERTNPIMGS